MYSNIGGKIKALAVIVTVLCIILCLVLGAFLIGNNSPALGIAVIILGSLASWISSFVLYGFGQLIENSDNLLYMTKKIKQSLVNKTESDYHSKEGEEPDYHDWELDKWIDNAKKKF